MFLVIVHIYYTFAQRYLFFKAKIMKNDLSPNTDGGKKVKLTLKDYYSALPKRKSPRKDFVQEVSERCGVSEQTVRNWCIYGMKPQDFRHVKILAEITGIKEEELWR